MRRIRFFDGTRCVCFHSPQPHNKNPDKSPDNKNEVQTMDATEQARQDMYRAAVGEKKADYYLPLFERFDRPGGSPVSWNWPAVFVTFFWMLYRRMYGLALAYFFALPLVTGMVAGMLGGILMVAVGQKFGVAVYLLLVLGVHFVAVPMFANVLYHGSVKRRIEKLSQTAPSTEAVVQRLIGQQSSVGVVVGVACIGAVFFIGILAAIAIPAYQDYTIRSQVAQGLNLATRAKMAVVEAYQRSESWPEDAVAAGLDAADLNGRFVESIEVTEGVVLVRYGNGAHAAIAGHTLALQPVIDERGIQWICGYAESDDEAPVLTDVPPRYLPTTCRSQPVAQD